MADAAAPARMVPLAEALARLPLDVPESAWPLLADRLAARRRRSRWPFALAAAAAVLAVTLLPRHAPVTTATQLVADSTATKPVVANGVGLSALMAESARLQRLLGAARDDGATSASAAAMGLILEDRLAALDSELRDETLDSAQQRALWQQRILLLREAASLETSRHYLAANGQGLDVALVSAY